MRGYGTISAYHCSYQVMSLMTISMGYHHGVDAVTIYISLSRQTVKKPAAKNGSGVQPDHGETMANAHGCAFTSSLNSTVPCLRDVVSGSALRPQDSSLMGSPDDR